MRSDVGGGRGDWPRLDVAVDLGGLLVLCVMALFQIAPPDYGSSAAISGGFFALVVAAVAAVAGAKGRAHPVRAAGACLAGVLLAYYVFAGLAYVWPLHLLIPLVVIVALSWGWGRSLLSSLSRRGRYGRAGLALTAATVAIVGLTLYVWLRLAEPDLSSTRQMLPRSPIALVATGLGFAAGNAILEEAVWRGLLLRWLALRGPSWVAILLQALSFGAAHWNGFPSGLAGAGLATIFGGLLGIAALRAGGLLGVIVTHAIVDAMIFAILVLTCL
jgi:uncharacterized protein